ncbi:MAG: PIG-L deacetylase family protein [Acidimicrobiales bacterium]
MIEVNAVGEQEPRDESGVVVAIDTATADAVTFPEAAPERVLVIVAHPDDMDFGAAGTIATWTTLGSSVTYCIITDGAAGSADPSIDLTSLVSIREEEQRRAGKAVGVSEIIFLGYPDGRLEPTQEVRRDLSRVIRKTRPSRIITQSPERNFDRIRASHPDHLAAGEVTLRAVYPDARNPFAHPELLKAGLEPFEVPEVWLMASPRAGQVVDITDAFDRKIEALSAHQSQISDMSSIASFMREWTAATAQRFGLGSGRLAEAFQVVDTR